MHYAGVSAALVNPDPVKKPRVRCRSVELAHMVSQQINYAKRMYIEYLYTLSNDNITTLEDWIFCYLLFILVVILFLLQEDLNSSCLLKLCRLGGTCYCLGDYIEVGKLFFDYGMEDEHSKLSSWILIYRYTFSDHETKMNDMLVWFDLYHLCNKIHKSTHSKFFKYGHQSLLFSDLCHFPHNMYIGFNGRKHNRQIIFGFYSICKILLTYVAITNLINVLRGWDQFEESFVMCSWFSTCKRWYWFLFQKVWPYAIKKPKHWLSAIEYTQHKKCILVLNHILKHLCDEKYVCVNLVGRIPIGENILEYFLRFLMSFLKILFGWSMNTPLGLTDRKKLWKISVVPNVTFSFLSKWSSV